MSQQVFQASCSMVANCETGGWSIDFSPELSVGELSCSTDKSSTALHLPLSLRFEALDLVTTILPCFPTNGAKLFRKETGWGETKARIYFWLMHCWSSDDGVSSPSPARRSISGVFPDEGPSDSQVSVQERNNVERKSRESLKENFLCGVCLISCHITWKSLPLR